MRDPIDLLCKQIFPSVVGDNVFKTIEKELIINSKTDESKEEKTLAPSVTKNLYAAIENFNRKINQTNKPTVNISTSFHSLSIWLEELETEIRTVLSLPPFKESLAKCEINKNIFEKQMSAAFETRSESMSFDDRSYGAFLTFPDLFPLSLSESLQKTFNCEVTNLGSSIVHRIHPDDSNIFFMNLQKLFTAKNINIVFEIRISSAEFINHYFPTRWSISKCFNLLTSSATGFLSPVEVEEKIKEQMGIAKFLHEFRNSLNSATGSVSCIELDLEQALASQPEPENKSTHSISAILKTIKVDIENLLNLINPIIDSGKGKYVDLQKSKVIDSEIILKVDKLLNQMKQSTEKLKSSILNFSKDSGLLKDAGSWISAIESSIENQLLLLNRGVESEVVESSFNLTDCFKELKAILSGKIQSENISFDIEAPSDTWIKTDYLKLKQILLNLLGNAFKFAESGKKRVSLTCAVETAEKSDHLNLTFIIENNGKNIAEEKIPTLFKDYAQEDEKIQTKFGGSGLGLSICKQLVAELDKKGTISCRSKTINEDEKRTQFIFQITCPKGFSPSKPLIPAVSLDFLSLDSSPTLSAISPSVSPITPLHFSFSGTGKSAGTPFTSSSPSSRRSSTSPYFNCKVLIVDDNPINLSVAQKIVSSYCHEVLTADSGDKAIELAKTKTFDLFFVDKQMPVTDGIKTIIEIRKYEKETGAKPAIIIILSGDSVAIDDSEYQALKIKKSLKKPISKEIILETLRENFIEGTSGKYRKRSSSSQQPSSVSHELEQLRKENEEQKKQIRTLQAELQAIKEESKGNNSPDSTGWPSPSQVSKSFSEGDNDNLFNDCSLTILLTSDQSSDKSPKSPRDFSSSGFFKGEKQTPRAAVTSDTPTGDSYNSPVSDSTDCSIS